MYKSLFCNNLEIIMCPSVLNNLPHNETMIVYE